MSNIAGKGRITFHSGPFSLCLYLLGSPDSLIPSDSKGELLWRFYIAGNSRTYLRLQVKCPVGTKFGVPRLVSINVPCIKLSQASESGGHAETCGQAVDGRTERHHELYRRFS